MFYCKKFEISVSDFLIKDFNLQVQFLVHRSMSVRVPLSVFVPSVSPVCVRLSLSDVWFDRPCLKLTNIGQFSFFAAMAAKLVISRLIDY